MNLTTLLPGRASRMLALLFCVGTAALAFTSTGVALGSTRAGARGDDLVVVPRNEAAVLLRKQAAGWKLTELGSLIAARVPVVLPAATGTELLATTDDDAVLQADQAQPSQATTNSTRALATARSHRYQRVGCVTSPRSLAMTAGTGFICDWGVTANMNWTSQNGYAATRWTERDAVFNNYYTTTSKTCFEQGCAWWSWRTPPTSHEVRFGEVESLVYARIDASWCG